MCKSKPAAAHTIGEDRFGRTLARIKCAGVDANTEQVRRGWAWVFTRYAPQDSPLFAIQEDARRARRGLWADALPSSDSFLQVKHDIQPGTEKAGQFTFFA